MAADPRIHPFDREDPPRTLLERVARLLYDGEIVAAPSDTVYGFLALPRSQAAREGLKTLKHRSHPFIVLVGSWEEARSWTREVSEETWGALQKIWPGPVTVILTTTPEMPGSEGGTIGIRMPDSAFLKGLLAEVGEPLFSTSANRPGDPPPPTAQKVAGHFPDGVALILDAGPADSNEPSTIVDLTSSPPRVIRAGRGNPEPLLDRD